MMKVQIILKISSQEKGTPILKHIEKYSLYSLCLCRYFNFIFFKETQEKILVGRDTPENLKMILRKLFQWIKGSCEKTIENTINTLKNFLTGYFFQFQQAVGVKEHRVDRN